MTSALSLYLDALRFAAAFTVFLSHYGVGRISGGLLWRVADYGHTAVLVFFVLSGFVIASVTDTRERRLEDYALSRASRLYSVMIPAFILTALLDCLGNAIDPTLYGPEWNPTMAHPALGYALSAVFLGESWTLAVLPGFNVPFWSLNYEAWYYILFAAATFLRGWSRAAALAGAALLAGPKIVLLLPVWLMGVAAWRWRAGLPARLAALIIAGSLAGFIALEAMGGQNLFWHPGSRWVSPEFSAYDYVLGAIVTLLIVGLASARLPMPAARFERIVHALAGTTFGLYLLHFPLLNFFATVVPGPPDGAAHRVLVFALALGCGLGLARLIEPRKRALKRGLHAMLGGRPATGGCSPSDTGTGRA
jgi:peptidoglycan/LPS O-acetylase OafA/YrhL